MAQYEKGIQWLKEALYKSQFVGQRVKVKANKLVNSIGDLKRSGPKLLDVMFYSIVFKNGECVYWFVLMTFFALIIYFLFINVILV